DGGTLAFHQLAFPGWRAWVDGQPVAVRVTPRIDAQAIQPGFLLVDVPAGSHRVAIRFGPDTPRLEGIGVSLAALAAAAAWLLLKGLGGWRPGRRSEVRKPALGLPKGPKSEVRGLPSAAHSRRLPLAVRRPWYAL